MHRSYNSGGPSREVPPDYRNVFSNSKMHFAYTIFAMALISVVEAGLISEIIQFSTRLHRQERYNEPQSLIDEYGERAIVKAIEFDILDSYYSRFIDHHDQRIRDLCPTGLDNLKIYQDAIVAALETYRSDEKIDILHHVCDRDELRRAVKELPKDLKERYLENIRSSPDQFIEAAVHGNLEMVKSLLVHHYWRNWDPINHGVLKAAENGHVEIVEHILQVVGFWINDESSIPVFKWAARKSNLGLIDLLLAETCFSHSNLKELFQWAAEHGNVQIIDRVLPVAALHGFDKVVDCIMTNQLAVPSQRAIDQALANALENNHHKVLDCLFSQKHVMPSHEAIEKMFASFKSNCPSTQPDRDQCWINAVFEFADKFKNLEILERFLHNDGLKAAVERLTFASHLEVPRMHINSIFEYAAQKGNLKVLELLLNFEELEPEQASIKRAFEIAYKQRREDVAELIQPHIRPGIIGNALNGIKHFLFIDSS